MSKRDERATVKLGWIMTAEAAAEGGASWAHHRIMAECWAEGFEYAKGPFHAEQLAALEIKVLAKEKPLNKSLLEDFENPKKSAIKTVTGARALYGPEPKL